ncbi:hypothetical protein L484_004131 [Morus notabilis]|uniref:Uncharacterized protein n=1 Tax=Morus notabilis TaxID=981085 RepID=W9SA71_9ROSA|nr:hypothetical protein L484_004131 [Morus notabilis]
MPRSSLNAVILTLTAAILIGFAMAVQSPAASPTKSPPGIQSPAVKPPIIAPSPESAASSLTIENSFQQSEAPEPTENGVVLNRLRWKGCIVVVGVVAVTLLV